MYKIIFPGNKEIKIDTGIISASSQLSQLFLQNGKYTEYIDAIYMSEIDYETFQRCIVFIKSSKDESLILDFIGKLSQNALFDLICAADYLKLNDLIHFLQIYMNSILKDYDVDEIRDKYSIVNDLDNLVNL